jgi:hypothetical protein
VAALLVGDMWRWQMGRKAGEKNDLAKAWRQTVRWLVADVPRRVELDLRRKPQDPGELVQLRLEVRDPEYQPMDNASVDLRITGPDGDEVQLRPEPGSDQAGTYLASYVPRKPGAYRVKAVVTATKSGLAGTHQNHAGEKYVGAALTAYESSVG